MKNIDDRCCWKRCRQPSAYTYYGVGLCNRHWEIYCSFKGAVRMVKRALAKRLIPIAARTFMALVKREERVAS